MMSARRIAWMIAAAVLHGAAMSLDAQEGYLQFKPQTSVSAGWVVAVLAVLVLGITVIYQVSSRIVARRQRAPAQRAHKARGAGFEKCAARLGFRIAEIKTLRVRANKLDPQDPEELLTTDAGRERLAADVASRIVRRQREVEFLERIQAKLDLMRQKGLHERATIRVEADLSVWIIKKAQESGPSDDEEDLFADVEQVAGRLLDLSEGGAAVSADLDVHANDMVELWSADPDVWIPPVGAGVLQVQSHGDGADPVLHLHFIDPPLQELRAALQALQRGGASADA
jgi:hypothetical protein